MTPVLGGEPGKFGARSSLNNRDNTGNNISERHHLWSEFTVYYWVWKNRISSLNSNDYVGIMHYRSFLELKKNDNSEEDFFKRLGLTSAEIESAMKGYDVAVTRPQECDFYDEKTSIYKQFCSSHNNGDSELGEKLFYSAYKALIENYKYKEIASSYYYDYFYKEKNPNIYFKSVFVSTKKYFEEYMEYLYYVLDYVEKNCEKIIGHEKDEKYYRLLAFFGERMTSLYIAYRKEKEGLKVKEVHRVHNATLSAFINSVYLQKQMTGVQPFVRAYSVTDIDHLYLSDYTEINDPNKTNYYCENCIGYIFKKEAKDSTTNPVYRLIGKTNGTDNIYTCNKEEYEKLKKDTKNYEDKEIVGNLFSKQFNGFVPLHRYCLTYRINGKDKLDHFYVTDKSEIDKITNAEKTYEGILGYIK